MSKKVKKTDQQVVDEFIDTFTPSNLIEKISLTFGDRHEHISFDDFKPKKEKIMKYTKDKSWFDFFVDYVQDNHRNIYNDACDYADETENL